MGHDKNDPSVQVCDHSPAPPTLPLIRVVLVHTETARKTLSVPGVFIFKNLFHILGRKSY